MTDSTTPAASVDLATCSSQVQLLFPFHAEYRSEVEKLWQATADNPGPRLLRRRGYAYLTVLYYEMARRSELNGRPMSPEFKNLLFFARYVGPRPSARHSLHRLDNERGYRVGNVEWADKRKQAEVRRTAQMHVYLGRRLSDRQLCELLATKGRRTTTAAIKKFRQRLRRRGVPPTEITRSIFERHSLPYATSQDPVEAWDFPTEFQHKLPKVYDGLGRKGEPRIKFYIRWLREQAKEFAAYIDNPLTPAEQRSKFADLVLKYEMRAKWAENELSALHQQKIDAVLKDAVAGWGTAADFVVKQANQSLKV